MKRWGMAVAAVLLTGACTIQPGGLTTSSKGDEDTIRGQVDTFVETIFSGRGGEAYTLMSDRCKAKDPKSTYVKNSALIKKTLVGDDVKANDVKVTTVDESTANVTYTLDIPQASKAKQRWIKESGKWHLDSCFF